MNPSPSSSLTAQQVTEEVCRHCIQVLDQCMVRIRHCVAQLTLEQLWWRPQSGLNSIGNLLLHLNGNVRQWLIAGLGDEADTRDRPSEFAERKSIPAEELLKHLQMTLEEAKATVMRQTASDLLAPRLFIFRVLDSQQVSNEDDVFGTQDLLARISCGCISRPGNGTG